MADVMICAQSAQVELHDESGETPDRLEWVRRDRTTAHADHPVVVNYPHLWQPLPINYPSPAVAADAVAAVDDPADDAYGGEPEPVDDHPPAAKDVRAWARDAEIDVPARGPIPDDVVEQYLEAQGG